MAKLLRASRLEKCIGCGACMLACARTRFDTLSLEMSAIRIRTAGGFRSSYIADLCSGCIEEVPCVDVCTPRALLPRPGGGVIIKRDLCIGCDRCTEACTVRGIRYDDELGYPVVCIHCGICARFCPHGCLTREETDG